MMNLLIPKFAFLVLILALYSYGLPASPQHTTTTTVDTITTTPSITETTPSITETTNWQPEPQTRGTFRLLFSCLITLSLCAWTGMHLNIPPTGLSLWQWIQKKVKWLLMGLFAPELVAFTAWAQWSDARELTVRMNEIFRNRAAANDPDFVPRKHPWTLIHSHYACMGGFVFDTHPTHPKESEFIPGSPRLTVNSHGLILLAQTIHLPDLSVESIQDHSKADDLAKVLVIMQAGWIVIDCIARVASKLPLTLLEVNTVAHVLCAFVIYGLWWDKPLNVFVPTVLAGEWSRPLAAWMFMASGVSVGYEVDTVKVEGVGGMDGGDGDGGGSGGDGGGCAGAGGGGEKHWLEVRRDCEFADLTFEMPEGLEQVCGAGRISDDSLGVHGGTQESLVSERLPLPQIQTQGLSPSTESFNTTTTAVNTPITPHISNETLHKFPCAFSPVTPITPTTPTASILFTPNPLSAYYLKHPLPSTPPSPTTLTRWTLSSLAITHYLHRPSLTFLYTNHHPLPPSHLRKHTSLLETYATNWGTNSGNLVTSNGWIASTGIAIASGIYASVHIAAWNTYFPTIVEETLWQNSATAILGTSINVALSTHIEKCIAWVKYLNPPIPSPNILSNHPTLGKILYHLTHTPFLFLKQLLLCFLSIFLYSGITQPFYDAADLVSSFPRPKAPIRSLVALLMVLMYCYARGFLVVEAFISLRELPVKAYITPRWSQMLPHI